MPISIGEDGKCRPPPDRVAEVVAMSERIATAARGAARAKGYALMVHGSLARDVDLLAVPWTEDAAPALAVVKAIQKAVADEVCTCWRSAEVGAKPHGRKVWTLLLKEPVQTINGGYPFIDLGVMPRRRKRR